MTIHWAKKTFGKSAHELKQTELEKDNQISSTSINIPTDLIASDESEIEDQKQTPVHFGSQNGPAVILLVGDEIAISEENDRNINVYYEKRGKNKRCLTLLFSRS